MDLTQILKNAPWMKAAQTDPTAQAGDYPGGETDATRIGRLQSMLSEIGAGRHVHTLSFMLQTVQRDMLRLKDRAEDPQMIQYTADQLTKVMQTLDTLASEISSAHALSQQIGN